MFTLHDLEYLDGHVAVIANHCEDKKLQKSWMQYSKPFRKWRLSMTWTTEITDAKSLRQEAQDLMAVSGQCVLAGAKA